MTPLTPPPVDLGEILFTQGNIALDHDRDGLKDKLEYELAEHFKPLLVFDSDEAARLPHEPVVLFQVRPNGPVGTGYSTPWRVAIIYVFLFKRDGGYGPSSRCGDAHAGDAQPVRFYLESLDGQSWRLTSIENGVFKWPDTPAEWFEGSHAQIYMSAHKHHQYFSTANDHKDSPYSHPKIDTPVGDVPVDWIDQCNDDVNGRGARVFPNLISPYLDQRPNNVGEPDAHSTQYFIHDLTTFGYAGEHAWSTKPFIGEKGKVSSLFKLWMKSPEYQVKGAIRAKWEALGGRKGILGNPTTDELATPDGAGRYNHFSGGSIFWTPETGAWEVHGAIQEKWASLYWPTVLGYPITDETRTPDGIGRFNHFRAANGVEASIYWTRETGAWEVHGAIREKWASLDWERGVLGYPMTDETVTPDGVGRFNHFQGGSIYWTPQTGAYEVHGLIRDKWAELGWERSVLGYPVSDEMPTPDGVGRFSRFQGGTIYWTPDRGAWVEESQVAYASG